MWRCLLFNRRMEKPHCVRTCSLQRSNVSWLIFHPYDLKKNKKKCPEEVPGELGVKLSVEKSPMKPVIEKELNSHVLGDQQMEDNPWLEADVQCRFTTSPVIFPLCMGVLLWHSFSTQRGKFFLYSQFILIPITNHLLSPMTISSIASKYMLQN